MASPQRPSGRGLIDIPTSGHLTFAQHRAASGIAVILLHAITNRHADVAPLDRLVVGAIAAIQKGSIFRELP